MSGIPQPAGTGMEAHHRANLRQNCRASQATHHRPYPAMACGFRLPQWFDPLVKLTPPSTTRVVPTT
jgi:hypothetical protein